MFLLLLALAATHIDGNWLNYRAKNSPRQKALARDIEAIKTEALQRALEAADKGEFRLTLYWDGSKCPSSEPQLDECIAGLERALWRVPGLRVQRRNTGGGMWAIVIEWNDL